MKSYGPWCWNFSSCFLSPLFDSHDDMQNCVIYLCATMWHETYDEMLKILTSMFRLETTVTENQEAQHSEHTLWDSSLFFLVLHFYDVEHK